jgi:UDP-glucose 4-epimerase
MNSSKTVLVTGGAGFIGSHVVDRLVSEGYSVRVLDDLSSGSRANIKHHLSSGNVELFEGDIRDATIVKKSLKGVDAVVHLAALISVTYSVEHPDSTFDVNLAGTLNLLRYSALEGVGTFIFASSCAVYGEPEALPISENAITNPISPYAESKLLGERYCQGFSARGLINAVVLRFFNVYGCRQGLNEYSGVITRYMQKIRQSEPLVIYGDGSQTRDFVSVADVVAVICTCIKNENVKNGVFNVGSGKATSICDLAATILGGADSNLAVCHGPSRVGDIKHSYADISHAKALLDYTPQVSLHTGLQALLEEKLVASHFG